VLDPEPLKRIRSRTSGEEQRGHRATLREQRLGAG
jgi:hypothetical protein